MCPFGKNANYSKEPVLGALPPYAVLPSQRKGTLVSEIEILVFDKHTTQGGCFFLPCSVYGCRRCTK